MKHVRYGLFLPLLLVVCMLAGGCGMVGGFQPSGDAHLATGEKIARTASGQLGKRYAFGGASPQKGFDCSGLVWWACRQNGVSVPRITSDQARAGMRIPYEKARPGDILVFRTGADSPRGLHTGLYMGGGSFIHSPRRGERVRRESVETPYWRRNLVAVRRVF